MGRVTRADPPGHGGEYFFEIVTFRCPGCFNRPQATRRGAKRLDGFMWMQVGPHKAAPKRWCSYSGLTLYPNAHERLNMRILATEGEDRPKAPRSAPTAQPKGGG